MTTDLFVSGRPPLVKKIKKAEKELLFATALSRASIILI